MKEDLVKRLREEHVYDVPFLREEAAAVIEKLQAEKDEWKAIGEEATSMHMQTAIALQTEIIRLKGVCTELNDELHRKAK